MLAQGIMTCRRRGKYNPGSREVFLQKITSLQGQFTRKIEKNEEWPKQKEVCAQRSEAREM